MNVKKLNEWNSGTVKKIQQRHPNGFVGWVIQGERGNGKSMYAYKVMAKIYQIINELPEEEAYAMALQHMIFSPRELIELIKHNIKQEFITPVICLDDATVHFSCYKFFIDLREVILLKGIFDTIRTAVTGLLMTCPSRKSLLKFLKDYDDYKIQIGIQKGADVWERFARCYQFTPYPDDRKYSIRVPYQDMYSCYVPDFAYQPYITKRKKYLDLINDKMEELLKDQEIRDKMKIAEGRMKMVALKKRIEKIRETGENI